MSIEIPAWQEIKVGFFIISIWQITLLFIKRYKSMALYNFLVLSSRELRMIFATQTLKLSKKQWKCASQGLKWEIYVLKYSPKTIHYSSVTFTYSILHDSIPSIHFHLFYHRIQRGWNFWQCFELPTRKLPSTCCTDDDAS